MNFNELFERPDADSKYFLHEWRSYVGKTPDGIGGTDHVYVCRAIVQTEDGQIEIHDFLMRPDTADSIHEHLSRGQADLKRHFANEVIRLFSESTNLKESDES